MEYPDYDGMGIYALVDQNGKMYIGSSKNVKRRFKEHEAGLYGGGHTTHVLYDAVRNGAIFHGEVIEKIAWGNNLYFLYERENYWIKKYNARNNGYNVMFVYISTEEKDRNTLKYEQKQGHNTDRLKREIERKSSPIYPPKKEKRFHISLVVKQKYKKAADNAGMSMAQFFTTAANEKIDREGLLPDKD